MTEAAAERTLENILHHARAVPGVRVLRVVDARTLGVEPEPLWREIIAASAVPTHRIADDAPEPERARLLRRFVDQSGMRESCYLSCGVQHPWVHLQVAPEADWLLDLWKIPDIQDLILLAPDARRILALTEEEDFDWAFIRPV